MITESMMPDEMGREVAADLIWVEHRVRMYRQEIDRWVTQQKQWPAWWTKELRSPRGNVWHVMDYHEQRWSRYSYYFTYTELQTSSGRYVVAPKVCDMSSGRHGYVLLLIQPHFFRRYRERLGLGDKLTNRQVVRRFMRRNMRGSEQGNQDKGLSMLAMEDGVCLGLRVATRMVMVKTFVTYDMERRWQHKRFQRGREEYDKVLGKFDTPHNTNLQMGELLLTFCPETLERVLCLAAARAVALKDGTDPDGGVIGEPGDNADDVMDVRHDGKMADTV